MRLATYCRSVVGMVLVWGMGFSVSAKAEEIPSELNETLETYRQSESMILEVRKTVKNVMLDKENTFKGMIRFVKGKFYWETSDPKKTWLFMMAKHFGQFNIHRLSLKKCHFRSLRRISKAKKTLQLFWLKFLVLVPWKQFLM